MRTEEEIRTFRNDLYRTAVIMKQNGDPPASLIWVFVSQLDWVLGDQDMNLRAMAASINKFEQDSKKLALI